VNSSGLNHRTESSIIINTILLFKSLDNQMGFVTINWAIRLIFELKYPLGVNDIQISTWRNKVLGLVTNESETFYP
jgi:hypothetical protein